MTLKSILFSISLFTAFCTQAQKINLDDPEKFTLHCQTTVVNQYKPSFKAPYTGENSLQTAHENKTSITSTLYLGAKLWKRGSFYFNPEISGGSGLSSVLGIGDATNGETFRVGSSSPKLYIARCYYQQIIPLSNATNLLQENEFNTLADNLPSKYLSITIGKVSLADYFDNNKYSHDPRTQFLCWSLMDNGAWDYAANTRGYTQSAILEYISAKNEFRYSFSKLPTSANGNTLNNQFLQTNSQTVEYAHFYKLKNHQGAIRLLSFLNIANMGNYNESIAQNPSAPVIENTRKYGRTKYGFMLNLEQDITKSFGCFFRAGWNDGKNETWVFTEIDKSISVGCTKNGTNWKRPNDIVGLAVVTSGLFKPHRDYLQHGGMGFMLGDGKLNYGLEHLTELYYSAEIIKNNLYFTGSYQLLFNPGYNIDRKGPVNIFSIRVHQRI